MKHITDEEMFERYDNYELFKHLPDHKPFEVWKVEFNKEDELVGLFVSVNEASHNLDLSYQTIKKALTTGKTIKGYHFEYLK